MRAIAFVLLLGLATPAAAQSIQGKWKLTEAVDLKADGSIVRYPFGRNPLGTIVVAGGACYVQIMSSDVPAFSPDKPPILEQMKALLLSSYIAYSGPCTINEAEGSLMLKVEAAWRPDYVGTDQQRFFHFEQGKLIFGPAPNSIRSGEDRVSRRLTLVRQP